MSTSTLVSRFAIVAFPLVAWYSFSLWLRKPARGFDELQETKMYLTKVGSNVLGPFTGTRIVAQLQSGELGPMDFVQDGSNRSRWSRVGDTPALRRFVMQELPNALACSK